MKTKLPYSFILLGSVLLSSVAQADLSPGRPVFVSSKEQGGRGKTEESQKKKPDVLAPVPAWMKDAGVSSDAGAKTEKDQKENENENKGGAKGEEKSKFTPEQRAMKKAWAANRKAQVKELLSANGKKTTDEEREALKRYWHRTNRAWRVRFAAENKGEQKMAERAKGVLARLDEKLTNQLKKMNEKAPVDDKRNDAKGDSGNKRSEAAEKGGNKK